MNEVAHLEQFNGLCSILTTNIAYRRFFRGQSQIGRPPDTNDPHGSAFVSTSVDIDKALKECEGDLFRLEASLGLPNGQFGNGPLVRVDINNPKEHGLRVATGKEAGANEFWNTKTNHDGNLPDIKYVQDSSGRWCVDTDKTNPEELSKLNGQYWDQNGNYHAPNPASYDGKTSGGMSEAVINQVSNTPEYVSYTLIDGFKRGQISDVETTKLTSGYSDTPSAAPITSKNIDSITGGGANAPNQAINRDIDLKADLGLQGTSRVASNNSFIKGGIT